VTERRKIIYCIGPCCENEPYIRELEKSQMTEQQVAARLTQWALSLGIVIQADTVDDALDQIAGQLDELTAPVGAQL